MKIIRCTSKNIYYPVAHSSWRPCEHLRFTAFSKEQFADDSLDLECDKRKSHRWLISFPIEFGSFVLKTNSMVLLTWSNISRNIYRHYSQVIFFLTRKFLWISQFPYFSEKDSPHSTEIFKKRRNIPCKWCKIAKIFRNLSLILLKYRNNLALITDYKLELFVTLKFKIMYPSCWTKIIKMNRFWDEIRYTEVFAITDAKTRDAKIP